MKLIFVYNADAGRLHAAFDSLHKLVSPGTYACSLCAVTHHPLGMKQRWRDFVEALPAEVEFLHRDEAVARYDVRDTAWPSVLRETAGRPEVWLDAATLGSADSLEALQQLIADRLANTS
ncbi:MAG: hypothetical protein AAFX76_14135 [Planctomycetota bacterium]